MSRPIMEQSLKALRDLLVRVADDEEYGPDHAITKAREAVASLEFALRAPENSNLMGD